MGGKNDAAKGKAAAKKQAGKPKVAPVAKKESKTTAKAGTGSKANNKSSASSSTSKNAKQAASTTPSKGTTGGTARGKKTPSPPTDQVAPTKDKKTSSSASAGRNIDKDKNKDKQIARKATTSSSKVKETKNNNNKKGAGGAGGSTLSSRSNSKAASSSSSASADKKKSSTSKSVEEVEEDVVVDEDEPASLVEKDPTSSQQSQQSQQIVDLISSSEIHVDESAKSSSSPGEDFIIRDPNHPDYDPQEDDSDFAPASECSDYSGDGSAPDISDRRIHRSRVRSRRPPIRKRKPPHGDEETEEDDEEDEDEQEGEDEDEQELTSRSTTGRKKAGAEADAKGNRNPAQELQREIKSSSASSSTSSMKKTTSKKDHSSQQFFSSANQKKTTSSSALKKKPHSRTARQLSSKDDDDEDDESLGEDDDEVSGEEDEDEMSGEEDMSDLVLSDESNSIEADDDDDILDLEEKATKDETRKKGAIISSSRSCTTSKMKKDQGANKNTKSSTSNKSTSRKTTAAKDSNSASATSSLVVNEEDDDEEAPGASTNAVSDKKNGTTTTSSKTASTSAAAKSSEDKSKPRKNINKHDISDVKRGPQKPSTSHEEQEDDDEDALPITNPVGSLYKGRFKVRIKADTGQRYYFDKDVGKGRKFVHKAVPRSDWHVEIPCTPWWRFDKAVRRQKFTFDEDYDEKNQDDDVDQTSQQDSKRDQVQGNNKSVVRILDVGAAVEEKYGSFIVVAEVTETDSDPREEGFSSDEEEEDWDALEKKWAEDAKKKGEELTEEKKNELRKKRKLEVARKRRLRRFENAHKRAPIGSQRLQSTLANLERKFVEQGAVTRNADITKPVTANNKGRLRNEIEDGSEDSSSNRQKKRRRGRRPRDYGGNLAGLSSSFYDAGDGFIDDADMEFADEEEAGGLIIDTDWDLATLNPGAKRRKKTPFSSAAATGGVVGAAGMNRNSVPGTVHQGQGENADTGAFGEGAVEGDKGDMNDENALATGAEHLQEIAVDPEELARREMLKKEREAMERRQRIEFRKFRIALPTDPRDDDDDAFGVGEGEKKNTSAADDDFGGAKIVKGSVEAGDEDETARRMIQHADTTGATTTSTSTTATAGTTTATPSGQTPQEISKSKIREMLLRELKLLPCGVSDPEEAAALMRNPSPDYKSPSGLRALPFLKTWLETEVQANHSCLPTFIRRNLPHLIRSSAGVQAPGSTNTPDSRAPAVSSSSSFSSSTSSSASSNKIPSSSVYFKSASFAPQWRWTVCVREDLVTNWWGFEEDFVQLPFPAVNERDDEYWADLVYRLTRLSHAARPMPWREFSTKWMQAGKEFTKLASRTFNQAQISLIEKELSNDVVLLQLRRLFEDPTGRRMIAREEQGNTGWSSTSTAKSAASDLMAEQRREYEESIQQVLPLCRVLRKSFFTFRMGLRMLTHCRDGNLPKRGRNLGYNPKQLRSIFVTTLYGEYLKEFFYKIQTSSTTQIPPVWMNMVLDHGATWLRKANTTTIAMSSDMKMKGSLGVGGGSTIVVAASSSTTSTSHQNEIQQALAYLQQHNLQQGASGPGGQQQGPQGSGAIAMEPLDPAKVQQYQQLLLDSFCQDDIVEFRPCLPLVGNYIIEATKAKRHHMARLEAFDREQEAKLERKFEADLQAARNRMKEIGGGSAGAGTSASAGAAGTSINTSTTGGSGGKKLQTSEQTEQTDACSGEGSKNPVARPPKARMPAKAKMPPPVKAPLKEQNSSGTPSSAATVAANAKASTSAVVAGSVGPSSVLVVPGSSAATSSGTNNITGANIPPPPPPMQLLNPAAFQQQQLLFLQQQQQIMLLQQQQQLSSGGSLMGGLPPAGLPIPAPAGILPPPNTTVSSSSGSSSTTTMPINIQSTTTSVAGTRTAMPAISSSSTATSSTCSSITTIPGLGGSSSTAGLHPSTSSSSSTNLPPALNPSTAISPASSSSRGLPQQFASSQTNEEGKKVHGNAGKKRGPYITNKNLSSQVMELPVAIYLDFKPEIRGQLRSVTDLARQEVVVRFEKDHLESFQSLDKAAQAVFHRMTVQERQKQEITLDQVRDRCGGWHFWRYDANALSNNKNTPGAQPQPARLLRLAMHILEARRAQLAHPFLPAGGSSKGLTGPRLDVFRLLKAQHPKQKSEQQLLADKITWENSQTRGVFSTL
ncbi:unnamed protein product [Amoebophrya sp. A25]|nr:unnamed protein product [Amoebophrya sp. A25]|eukprot:GSA25T00020939001.1